jgi:hypothetical protein
MHGIDLDGVGVDGVGDSHVVGSIGVLVFAYTSGKFTHTI